MDFSPLLSFDLKILLKIEYLRKKKKYYKQMMVGGDNFNNTKDTVFTLCFWSILSLALASLTLTV